MVSVDNGIGIGNLKDEIEESNGTPVNDFASLNLSTSRETFQSCSENPHRSSLSSLLDKMKFVKFCSASAKFKQPVKDQISQSASSPLSDSLKSRFSSVFSRKLDWGSIKKMSLEWIRNPMNMALFVWIICVAVSGAILFLVMTGMLNAVLPSKSQRNAWFEVNNQILNALFTLMCLYQHPKRFHHLVLLFRWRPNDISRLRNVYSKNGTHKPHEWAHMMVVVILLHLNCFSQYALCGLNLGYKRAERPAIGVGICVSFAIGAPAIAGLYAILSPLGKDYDCEMDEEAQVKKYSFASKDQQRVIEKKPNWSGGVLDIWNDISLSYLMKELRRNSFMVLIPEEDSCPEEGEDEEEEGETSSNEWRDVEAEGQQWWRGFDAVFEKYCEKMLFFDRMSMQQLNEIGKGSLQTSTQSPRSASKKLTSPLRCLSLKKFEEPDEDTEHLQQPGNDPYLDIEMAYVGQICLTWEALHCQYSHTSQKISWQPENPTCYNHSAQEFQQFQVLLQRFIENEPFEQGPRAESYARTRKALPKLLQVPNIRGSDHELTDDSDMRVLAPDLIRIIENSILTFHLFLKRDKKKSSGVINLFGNQNQLATPLQQVQSTLDKKVLKLKELRRKVKGWKKNSWPQKHEDIQLLLGLIDAKIISRVLRMTRMSREQLFWCEEKMKKLDLSNGRLERDPCPILFPC